MEWFMIFVSVAVLWFASLCKILHASFYTHRSSFLNNVGSLQKRNVLLVIAHPDDESMFFSPTINQLTSRGHNVHILCMSTGNADDMGNVRKEELLRASATLKVPTQQVTVMDHPDFQDGFGKIWNTSLLSNIVEKKIHDHAIDTIITFDNYGVSGHCNHRDVHHGVRRFMLDTSQQDIEAWELIVPMANIGSSSATAQTRTTTAQRKTSLRPRSVVRMKEIRTSKRPKTGAVKNKKSSKLDAHKPKKPPTAFFYFLEDFRKEFQQQNPDVKSMREIGKACGEKWKIMTYEEKVQYYDIATNQRAKFEKDLADYAKKKEDGEYDELDEDSDYDE